MTWPWTEEDDARLRDLLSRGFIPVMPAGCPLLASVELEALFEDLPPGEEDRIARRHCRDGCSTICKDQLILWYPKLWESKGLTPVLVDSEWKLRRAFEGFLEPTEKEATVLRRCIHADSDPPVDGFHI